MGLVLGLLLSLGPTSVGADSSANQRPGLGLEPINRGNLREGLRGYVSEDALSLANSAGMSPARAIWVDDNALVDQIDYQLSFRSSHDYLSSEPDHLERLLRDRPQSAVYSSMNIFMTPDEVKEFDRRQRLGDLQPAVVALVSGIDLEGEAAAGSTIDQGLLDEDDSEDPFSTALPEPVLGTNFAGLRMNQEAGGRLELAVVHAHLIDTPALLRLVGGARNIAILEQPYSLREMRSYQTRILDDLEGARIPFDMREKWSGAGWTYEISVSDPSSLPSSFAEDVPRDAYEVVSGGVLRSASAPQTQHPASQFRAGIAIGVFDRLGGNGALCGWGFSMHTSSLHYLMTASHCLPGPYENYSGNSGQEVVVKHAPVFSGGSSMVSANPYVKAILNSTYDFARISSPYATDNCLHTSGDCGQTMQNRALNNSWEPGSDYTCASLSNSQVYRCGTIIEENAAPGGRRVRVQGLTAIPGDSGSGVAYGRRVDGVITHINSSGEAIFNTAYDIVVQLGADFNCHASYYSTTAPGNWGTCPGVDA